MIPGMTMRRKKHAGLYDHQKTSIDYIIRKMNHLDFPWIQKVVLFGSCATGKNRYDSDVDVLFITDDDYRHYKDQMLDLKRELIGLDYDVYAEVDPKFYTATDVYESSSTFMVNVRNEGIILWDAESD